MAVFVCENKTNMGHMATGWFMKYIKQEKIYFSVKAYLIYQDRYFITFNRYVVQYVIAKVLVIY